MAAVPPQASGPAHPPPTPSHPHHEHEHGSPLPRPPPPARLTLRSSSNMSPWRPSARCSAPTNQPRQHAVGLQQQQAVCPPPS